MSLGLDAALATLTDRLRRATVAVRDGSRGGGSGVIWRSDGTIVTNAHVVRGTRATVEFADGRREPATLAARDASRDLAILRTLPAGLETVSVRTAPSVRTGELVFAVGNPLGLRGAVTAGIVQRCNARWVVADVRLAPGNSGGPLADAAGDIVGINSMVAGALAFAVPSSAVDALLATVEAPSSPFGVEVLPVALPMAGRREPAPLWAPASRLGDDLALDQTAFDRTGEVVLGAARRLDPAQVRKGDRSVRFDARRCVELRMVDDPDADDVHRGQHAAAGLRGLDWRRKESDGGRRGQQE